MMIAMMKIQVLLISSKHMPMAYCYTILMDSRISDVLLSLLYISEFFCKLLRATILRKKHFIKGVKYM